MKKIFWFLLIFSLFIGVKNVEAVGNGYVATSPILRDVASGSVANSSTPQTNPNGYVPTSPTLHGVASGSPTSSSNTQTNPNGYVPTSTTLRDVGSGAIGALGSSDAVTPAPKFDFDGDGSDDLNNGELDYKSCGDIEKIPAPVPKFTSFAYNALKVLTPVVLIVIGSFDLLKSVMSGKEDEIKKAQASFVKKLLIGGLVFLVALIVQYVIKIAAKAEDSNGAISCMDCFLNEKC